MYCESAIGLSALKAQLSGEGRADYTPMHKTKARTFEYEKQPWENVSLT